MTKSFTPSFKVSPKINVAFSTYNPAGKDRTSQPFKITELRFNEATRSIEVVGDDARLRQARIDRFTNEADVKSLTKRLQSAYDKDVNICTISAGGFDPNVFFYNIVESV
jgi:hypothetical protein